MLRAVALITTLAIPAVSAAQQPCTPNAQQVVNQLYRTMLERSADRGNNDFVQRLSTGQSTVRDLVRELALSREHLQRFSSANNTEAQRRNAVTAFYRHILGRDPDPGGLQAHIEGLRTQGPEAVVEAMLNSDEYSQRFGDFTVPGTGRRYCGANLDTRNRRDRFAIGTTGVYDDAAARFEALDRNGDGRIERNEWRGTAAEFTRLDTNRNNLLSREEVGVVSNPASDDFRQLDLNNDGRLTIEEWNWNRRSFDQQDVNGDGVITAREFTGPPINNRNGF